MSQIYRSQALLSKLGGMQNPVLLGPAIGLLPGLFQDPDGGKVPALVCLRTERVAAWARRALQRHLSGLWAGRLAAHRTARLAGQLAAHLSHACHLGPARHPVMCWSPAPGSCQCPHCPWPGSSWNNTIHQEVVTNNWQHACHILSAGHPVMLGRRVMRRPAGQLQLSVA